MSKNICPICESTSCSVTMKTNRDKVYPQYYGECEVCGLVSVGIPFWREITENKKMEKSDRLGYLRRHSFLREQRGVDHPSEINSIEDLTDGIVYPSTPIEQIYILIEYIACKQKALIDYVEFDESKDYTICFAKNKTDFCFLIDSAYKEGYLEGFEFGGNPVTSGINRIELNDLDKRIKLTFKGWTKYHELKEQSPLSKQVFVAFDFKKDNKMSHYYDNSISPAIKECGLVPFTPLYHDHGEKITDIIIANIRKSRFIVADVTHASQNVYYEAGFAYGLGLPVILTCREDSAEEDMKFDTSHIKHILWDNEEDLKKKLINRIEAEGLAQRK